MLRIFEKNLLPRDLLLERRGTLSGSLGGKLLLQGQYTPSRSILKYHNLLNCPLENHRFVPNGGRKSELRPKIHLRTYIKNHPYNIGHSSSTFVNLNNAGLRIQKGSEFIGVLNPEFVSSRCFLDRQTMMALDLFTYIVYGCREGL
jgi:hypothetical protein